MEDANGEVTYDVSYALSPTSHGVILSVIADTAWMNAEDRAYPVIIDPTINVKAGSAQDDIYTSYVAQGDPDASHGGHQYFYLGYTECMICRNTVALHTSITYLQFLPVP